MNILSKKKIEENDFDNIEDNKMEENGESISQSSNSDEDECGMENTDSKETIEENNEDDVDGDIDNDIEPEDEELLKLKEKLEEETKKSEEYLDMLKRKAAEFDNYKKRTVKEKSEIYVNAFCEAMQIFLPVIDNFERAVDAFKDENSKDGNVREGVEMVFKQMKEALKSNGVEEIECKGKTFDPKLHEAVMHVEDDNLDENVVVDVFQKGYIYKDKVIRHSSVKVAN